MNPFHFDAPAFVSFSGGRTSAMMLHRILEAHAGTLPDHVKVGFANTGKERPETLRFVHECGARWGVDIEWVEWRATPKQAARACLAEWLTVHDPERRLVHADGFERVGLNSASRNGEPFAALIAFKKRLPNWSQRWCTSILKVELLFALAASHGFAPGAYQEVIGLRHDEGWRILRGLEKAETSGRLVAYPLSKAKIEKADVAAFWRSQPFDLGLEPHEGNCDLCFLKGKALRKRIIRDTPHVADWWMYQEISREQFFDRRDRVASLIAQVREAPELGDMPEEEYDVECGTACGDEP